MDTITTQKIDCAATLKQVHEMVEAYEAAVAWCGRFRLYDVEVVFDRGKPTERKLPSIIDVKTVVREAIERRVAEMRAEIAQYGIDVGEPA